MWTPEIIAIAQQAYGPSPPEQTIVSIAMDLQEIAIVVVSEGRDGHFRVLGHWSVRDYFEADYLGRTMMFVASAVADHGASYVLVEDDRMARAFVEELNKGSEVPVRSFRFARPRSVACARAAELYKRGIVHHAKNFPALDRAMLEWEERSWLTRGEGIMALIQGLNYLSHPRESAA